jgi:hypothetical protein
VARRFKQPSRKEKDMANKVVCRPERTKKTGPKNAVKVKSYTRSKPKPISPKCGR